MWAAYNQCVCEYWLLVSARVRVCVHAKMANGLLSTHATATPPLHISTSATTSAQLPINNQAATGNNLKDTKRNRKRSLKEQELKQERHSWSRSWRRSRTRQRYQDLSMFELRLQFYQRNDISLKALKGLAVTPGKG